MVNVPINSDDIRNTLDQIRTFPRQPIEGGLLSVKLKRKMEWKAHHLHRVINRQKVIGAVQHFKKIGHPLYQDIDINTDYTPEFHFDDEDQSQIGTNCDN